MRSTHGTVCKVRVRFVLNSLAGGSPRFFVLGFRLNVLYRDERLGYAK